MLFYFTILIDFLGMGITLWLAFYLLGRGFPSRLTLYAVVTLLAIAAFFLGAYLNVFQQIPGTAAWRAVLLTVALASWFNLTHGLFSPLIQIKLRWLKVLVYGLGLLTVILLTTTHDAFIGEPGNQFWVGHMGVGLPYVVYGAYQLVAAAAILLNFVLGRKFRLNPQNRYFFIASLFPAIDVLYGVSALVIPIPLPRFIQDGLILCGIILLGLSIARHQSLIERRTTLQDLPVSGVTILGLSAISVFLAWKSGLSPEALILVVGTTILFLSIYDLARELLERLRYRSESAFRRQLRSFESEFHTEITLQQHLEGGLKLMCQTLDASAGFIAIRQGEQFTTIVSYHSIPLGSRFPITEITCEDICQPSTAYANDIAWFAPAFEASDPIAVVGIGFPKNKSNFVREDLDLLMEVADRVGMIVSLQNRQPQKATQLRQLAAEVFSNESDLTIHSKNLVSAITSNPDPQFVLLVEDSLKHLSDFITLGQMSLVEWAGIKDGSHIERGKIVHQWLVNAIETLRPETSPPLEPLPREWHNYVVLHDAYVKGVTNREIMARLYISERTLYRTRQIALRGLARHLLEKRGEPSTWINRGN